MVDAVEVRDGVLGIAPQPFAHRIDAVLAAPAIDGPLHGGLEEIPLRGGNGFAGGGIGHFRDDRDRHGDRRLLVLAVEREPHVEGVEDKAFLADVDVAARAKGAELAIAAADIDDPDERALRVILLTQVVEQEALARAGLGRDDKVVVVDPGIEEVERDQLTLAADVEERRAPAPAKIGLHRRHQRRGFHRHPEIALEQLHRALFRIEPERQAGGEQHR